MTQRKPVVVIETTLPDEGIKQMKQYKYESDITANCLTSNEIKRIETAKILPFHSFPSGKTRR